VGERRGEVHTGIWWGDVRERECLGDLGVDGRLLKWTLGTGFGGMDWINLAEGRDRWRPVVNAVMNLRSS
jgi:hypothetical protein